MQKRETVGKLLSGLIVLFFACQSALAADDPDHELNFGGDIRARYEPLIQKGTATRHRERIRVRFNLTGKLSDEISGGLRAGAFLERPREERVETLVAGDVRIGCLSHVHVVAADEPANHAGRQAAGLL